MEKVLAWITENIAVIAGAGFAFLISVLTKRGTFWERLTGGALCSLFSTGLFYGLVSVFPTCPPEAAVAIGSFVGFYGVDQCKELLLDKLRYILTQKTGGNNDDAH